MKAKHGDRCLMHDGSIVIIRTLLLHDNFYYSELYKPFDLIMPSAYHLWDIEYDFGNDISLAEIQSQHPEYFV